MKAWYTRLPNSSDLEEKYDNIGPLQNDRAVVTKNQIKGYINEKGEEVIPLQYEIAIGFIGNKAHVLKDGTFYFINTDGAII
jgi:hypothetical protein